MIKKKSLSSVTMKKMNSTMSGSPSRLGGGSQIQSPVSPTTTGQNVAAFSGLTKGTKGYATDIKRLLITNGCIDQQNRFDTSAFINLIVSGQLDIDIF